MTIRLADNEISELVAKGRLIPCIAVVCRVCGFRQHVQPHSFLPAHERCPMGCVLPTQEGQCRLCGDPTQSRYSKVVCPTHCGRNYHRYGDGCYVTQIAETHWHAAEGTGPVTQYAATQKVEASA